MVRSLTKCEKDGARYIRPSAVETEIEGAVQEDLPTLRRRLLITDKILFGETVLRRALREYLAHYHAERNHQGKGNVLLFPTATKAMKRVDGSVVSKERLAGLLKYYHREAA